MIPIEGPGRSATIVFDDSDEFFDKYGSYEDYLDAQITEKDT